MKTIRSLALWIFIALIQSVSNQLWAQARFPSVFLRTLNNEIVDASTIKGEGKALLVIIWILDDRKSCENLCNLHETLNESDLKAKVRTIAICVEQPGSSGLVKSFVGAKEIGCEVYLDTNGEFIRALGVKPPHTLLYDSDMNIHCQLKGYCTGNQELLCKELRHCIKTVD